MGLPEHGGLVGDSLFDFAEDKPEWRGGFDRDGLRDRLKALAARKIFLGGSSWKYEGWLGQIYTPSRYQTRGRFSKKLFEETCLSEYSAVFPAVCGDFSFYQFPAEAFWAKLFGQSPEGFQWALKVPEQITAPSWPVHPRYGALAGLENHTFLDFALFEQGFLRALAPYRAQTGVLIFEFGPMLAKSMGSVAQFVKKLEPFLAQLPAGWRYAVEIRNAEFLAGEYFECLRAHEVSHVFNAWTRMPEMQDQMAMQGSQTAELIVARALLRRARPYEDAVRMFAPYERVQDANEPVRAALRGLMDVAEVDGRPAFLFINNRLEGNAPGTIAGILKDVWMGGEGESA